MSRTARSLAAVVLGTAVAGSALIVPADASGGDRVIKTGACAGSGSTTWKLKAKTDDGRIEVEGEVDSNKSGQTWHWVLKRNGNTVAKGTGTTAGASGSFSVERRISNTAGTDNLTFRATRADETCTGKLAF